MALPRNRPYVLPLARVSRERGPGGEGTTIRPLTIVAYACPYVLPLFRVSREKGPEGEGTTIRPLTIVAYACPHALPLSRVSRERGPGGEGRSVAFIACSLVGPATPATLL